MGNLAITYQHIADILSFETKNSELEKTLSDPLFNWDAIVVEGSKHLVLPALYCRLKAKHLLHVLPDELNAYLEEITTINRNRNDSIIKQVHALSQLLNVNNIEHVFLKGAALITANYYEDIAERMIGDIDILIAEEHLKIAFNLLKKEAYTATEHTLGHQYFEHKHLPRLRSKNQICAVELHLKLFTSFKDKKLYSKAILKDKKQDYQIYIPDPKHLLMHNILNFQISDKGALYNSISFRSVYDTIVIQRTFNTESIWYNDNYYKNYLKYAGLFFRDVSKKTKVSPSLLTSFYLFKLKHIRFYKIWNKILNIGSLLPILFKRFWLFICNKSYRNAVISDRNRIFNHLKSILTNH